MTYDVLKFLHVIIAIAWLGGAFSMILLGGLAMRANDSQNLLAIARNTEVLAKYVFMPSSLVMLVLGVFLVWQSWSFAEAWVVIGIIGVVLTGAIGGAILTPMVKKLAEAGDGPDAAAIAGMLLRAARADLVMLAVIVWGMVSKPAWSDVGEIIVMLAVIVLGGILFLRK